MWQRPRTLMDYLGLAAEHLQSERDREPSPGCGSPSRRYPRRRPDSALRPARSPLDQSEIDAYRRNIARRARREPVAYITGTA